MRNEAFVHKNETAAPKGSSHPNSRLDEVKVLEILTLWTSGWDRHQLSKQYGVTPDTIIRIVTRKSWRHVEFDKRKLRPMDKPVYSTFGTNHPKSKLTEENVREIRQLFKNGIRQIDIARQFGVCNGTIMRVVMKTTWRHVE